MATHHGKPTGLRIGYARVSTYEQSLDSQIDRLKQAGCQRIYYDKVSGTKADRPELNRLRESLRGGDTLVVWRLDRLGRSLRDLIDWVAWLDKVGGHFAQFKRANRYQPSHRQIGVSFVCRSGRVRKRSDSGTYPGRTGCRTGQGTSGRTKSQTQRFGHPATQSHAQRPQHLHR